MVMFNLFDILQSQGGGVQALGQQFGLAPDQSRRAMEALLPALTIGLQRNAASDPAGFGRLFGLAGAGPYPGARPPAQPDMLLGQLFGSPALSQAVLQQAAAASGIGQQALRQMLPIMAGMVVAGIVHAMLNQPPPAVREPEPQPPAAFPAAEFWQDWMNSFLSSGEPGVAGQDKPSRERSERPAAQATSRDRQESIPPSEPATDAKPSGESDDVPLEVFQQMFQTGVQVQEQNVRAMQDLFDSFWSSPTHEGSTSADAPSPQEPAGHETPKKKRAGARQAPGKASSKP